MAQDKIIVTKSQPSSELYFKELKNIIQQLESHAEYKTVLNHLLDNLKRLLNENYIAEERIKRDMLIKQIKNELEQYIEEIDFPVFMHLQILLSSLVNKEELASLTAAGDKGVLTRITAYIQRLEFKKAKELLHTVTQFDACATVTLSNQSHPLFHIFVFFLFNRWKSVLTPEQTLDMHWVIYLLREKGCVLPFNLWGREDTYNPNYHDEKNFFHCLLLLGLKKHESQLKERLRTTAIWSDLPVHPSWNSNVYCNDDFTNVALDTTSFIKIRDYFINVSQLFSDEKACLKYLALIDKQLEDSGFALDLQKVIPEGYMGTRFFNFPVSSPTHTSTKKFEKLRQVLRNLLQGTSEHPEINLLPSGDFWDIYGFIEPKLAKELALKGELFWDKRYDLQANIHGSASHPLQFAILTLAHLSGECSLPEGMTMRDVLKYAFSIKIRLNNSPVWVKLFDVTHDKFSSPQFIQTVIMGPLGEKHCPLLCAYMRDSFWRHYQLSREKHQAPLESQILFDLLFYNLFLGDLSVSYSMSDLQERYNEQGIRINPYADGLHTVFKKERAREQPEDGFSMRNIK